MLNRLMRAVAAVAVVVIGSTSSTAGQGNVDPDALYRDRETPASARMAADIWKRRAADAPDDIESGWKFARACYWMGTSGVDSQDARRAWLQEGIAAARVVMAQAPARPEGHFWLAANMGALAEGHGLREGIRYRRPTREALETVLKLDPGYLDGSADRALGRWFFKVPGMMGGDKTRAEHHLRKALAYKTDSVISLIFLAELLIDRNKIDEARGLLEAAVSAPVDPQWIPEDRRFKEQARALLASLASRKR
jgi:TRAP transporter T-component